MNPVLCLYTHSITSHVGDLQVELLLPDRIEVAINGLGPLLGLAHLNSDVWIAGSRLVLCLKSLGANNYCNDGQTKTWGKPISMTEKWLTLSSKRQILVVVIPVMVILADHFEVPSRTLCLMVFICWAWMALLMTNTSLMSSKISGLFLSLIFIRSFMAMIIFWVRSSAPCLELFSAAPEHLTKMYSDKSRLILLHPWQGCMWPHT